jgi:hypothetical protein
VYSLSPIYVTVSFVMMFGVSCVVTIFITPQNAKMVKSMKLGLVR